MKRLLLGPRAVMEGLRAGAERIAVVYTESALAGSQLQAVLELARRSNVKHEGRTREELDALADGARHQGVLAVAGEYPYLALPDLLAAVGTRPLLVALDQVQDPHNFGAIVRSCVALGADGIITLKDRAAPVTSAVVRASAGASELARIARVTNLSRTLFDLWERGLQTVGLDAEGAIELRSLPTASSGRVLVVGSEGHGLRRLVREQCEVLVRIDLRGPLASLNAATAAGIAIYESVSQSRTEGSEHGREDTSATRR